MAEVVAGLSGVREQMLARVADAAIDRERATRADAAERDREMRQYAASARRLDAYLETQNEQQRRAEQQDERNDAEIARQGNLDTQVNYDNSVFALYGERCPAPEAGQSQGAYQRNLMRLVQERLSPTDQREVDKGVTIGQIAQVNVDTLRSRTMREMMEPMFRKAARLQADVPHPATLPPAGSFVARHKIDHAGRKILEWHGKRSFIADLTLPGRKVARIIAGNRVIYGPSFPRTPGS